ncbi:uncharacterized protein LOC128965281 [Oppia nitens]|uniref:uncharacterized protein LOC128965281 n=1 Tax=Oppia nitens TaxID=1686743 RepID=UPI0023DCDE4D|nr:uncharacterized protein LOC128965281 [Oppia nitens]
MYKIKPEDYASLANNSDEINLKLIQLITNEKCSYDLIVDLGFGDGRVTRMLSENISHKQLVAIDVVPEMLAYAVANSSDDTSIEYVLQDMSVPWLELSPRIRQLESKVDLLFTNLTLNYMSNKRQIIEIIGRLLSSDGLFFANIILSDDLNDKQLLNSQTEDRQQQQQQRQQLLYHSIDRQLNDWKQCLVDNGFDIKLFKQLTINEIMTRKHIIDMMPDIFNTYAIYYNDRKQFDTEVKVDDHFMDKVFNAYFSLPDKSVSASASVTVANHPMLLSWKQFFKDNTIHELMHSFQYLQLMAYKKYNK